MTLLVESRRRSLFNWPLNQSSYVPSDCAICATCATSNLKNVTIIYSFTDWGLLVQVKNLHKYDCLRANKSMLAWGVEARVPFLDREFLDYAMTLDPEAKMVGIKDGKKIEKFAVRAAFDDPEDPFLPHDILWRQKEQFSDGVGTWKECTEL